MTRSILRRALPCALLGLLVVAPTALADSEIDRIGFAGRLPQQIGINSAWVIIAGILVMFMQAGFAMLEIGFVRGKNAGSVVAKVLINFAICGLVFWAVGFAFAFGGNGWLLGTSGFFIGGSHSAAGMQLCTRPRPTCSSSWAPARSCSPRANTRPSTSSSPTKR